MQATTFVWLLPGFIGLVIIIAGVTVFIQVRRNLGRFQHYPNSRNFQLFN